MELQLSNVVTVSIAEVQSGLSNFNMSNLALFTADAPDSPFASGYKIYKEPVEVGTDFGTDSQTYKMALSVFSQQPNILAGGGYLVVIPLLVSETMGEAVARTKDLVQYFGCMNVNVLNQADLLEVAAVLQALNKIGFFVNNDPASIDSGGALDLLRSGGFTHSRGLFYGDEDDTAATLVMQAAYASRALSVDFTGSNTTITMQLKDLTGVQPDPSSNLQTLYTKALAAGVDVYMSVQGPAKVLCSGENEFYDDVYNEQWLVGALQVALFNALAQTSTKLPQTEAGMDVLKGAVRNVAEQAKTNQMCAPGVWNSPVTFGNQADLVANVAQRGYYIYSLPVGQQSQADREDRKAPLIQVAMKLAGAIHSASVTVYINK